MKNRARGGKRRERDFDCEVTIKMKRLHLICNAHIDPIWQWTWDEGLSSAIATFKSAADLAEEFDYIFCHNEALLYEAIELYAPELFKRIQNIVERGRWRIMGGWYLQPDCLMPCGETIVRQIAYGRKYFKEKFNAVPRVATNFDSFGHSVGLVQILAKSGYTGYMTCRPNGVFQFDYPSRFFRWTAPDGSSLIATQSASYNSAMGEAVKKIEWEARGGNVGMLGSDESTEAEFGDEESVDYVLWGVGNHGGGPSRKDLSEIAALKMEGIEILHSTPETLFSDGIEVKGEVKRSLVTCMPGCYSSMMRVKQAYRKTENLFYATEKMLSTAMLCGLKPDFRELYEAEKKLLLASFHDILPGTCIEDGEREGLGLLAAAEKSLKDYRTQAFLYLVTNESTAKEGEFPVFVFNYHPYEITLPVEAEFSLADQNWREDAHFRPHVYDEEGNELCCQQIKEESTLNLDWRKRIVFEGRLKPLGVTRFTVKVCPEPPLDKSAKPVPIGEIPSLALELYEDTADPWGMSAEELKSIGKNPKEFALMSAREAGRFCGSEKELSSVRIVEEGEVFTLAEAFLTTEEANGVLQYKSYKNQPYTDVKVTVEFSGKNKLVRLRIPLPERFKKGKIVGDGPCVWEEKPSSEFTFQKWLGAKSGEEIFAIINDGVYGGKAENGYIYLTLLRGAGYCMHPIPNRELYPKDRYLPRIECGRYVYNFRLYTGTVYEVNSMAEVFNQPPYAVNVFPVGGESKVAPLILSEGKVNVLSVKPSEKGRYVFRLYNPNEKPSEFSLRIGDALVRDIAKGREIVSCVFEKNKWRTEHDSMPI